MQAKMALLEKNFNKYLVDALDKFHKDSFFSIIFSNLRLIEVKFNTEIKTARIFWGKNFNIKIEISPLFYKNYIKTTEDFVFLLSHEILHFVLGHIFPEGKRIEKIFGKKISNMAMDIVANQIIYFFLKENIRKIKIYEFYFKDGEEKNIKCPISLFVPSFIVNRDSLDFDCRKWFDFIKNLNREKIMEIVSQTVGLAEHLLKHHSKDINNIVFLTENISLPEIPEDILNGIIFSIKDIDNVLNERKGQEVKKARLKLKEEVLKEIKEMVEDELGAIDRILRGGGVLPFYDRKDFLFLSLGVPTLLYHSNPYPQEEGGVRVYVDVSGSFFEDLPHIFYALESIKDWIIYPIYGFSTKVFSISKKDLLKGKYKTTGGTDFNCIANHLRKERFTKAIVITDGESKMSRKNSDYLKRNCDVLTILTSNGNERYVKDFSSIILKLELKNDD